MISNKLFLILIFVSIAISSLLVGNGVTQSFQSLYAKTIEFEYNGVGVTLQSGLGAKGGLNTVTIPDETGTIATSANSYLRVLQALKAVDVAHGSHSGINWTSFGT